MLFVDCVFEMNFKFNMGVERIAALEELRKPGVIFPSSWDPHRNGVRTFTFLSAWVTVYVLPVAVIIWLLQHRPDKRPSSSLTTSIERRVLQKRPLNDGYISLYAAAFSPLILIALRPQS